MIYMNMVTTQWSHRLRNQAQIIVEQVNLLRQDLELPETERKRLPYRLDMIARLGEEIKRKPIKDPLDPEKGVRLEPANPLLRETISRLTATWSRNEATSRIDLELAFGAGEGDLIAVNREWFEIVIEHVLQNAAQYAGRGPAPRIVVASRRVGKTVEIVIADNGPGIPENRRKSLLEAPLDKEPDEPGLGMGLFIAQMIMETYQGRITISVNEPQGAVITLSFPRKLVSVVS